jgi:hypothetical protein
MLDIIKERIESLAKMLEQSAAQHNALLGAKRELEAIYNSCVSAAPVVEEVVAAVDPSAAPALDAVVSAVEDVVASS